MTQDEMRAEIARLRSWLINAGICPDCGSDIPGDCVRSAYTLRCRVCGLRLTTCDNPRCEL